MGMGGMGRGGQVWCNMRSLGSIFCLGVWLVIILGMVF